MELLFVVDGKPSARKKLRNANLAAFKYKVVPCLLIEYNGNTFFKQPSSHFIKERKVAQLNGMD